MLDLGVVVGMAAARSTLLHLSYVIPALLLSLKPISVGKRSWIQVGRRWVGEAAVWKGCETVCSHRRLMPSLECTMKPNSRMKELRAITEDLTEVFLTLMEWGDKTYQGGISWALSADSESISICSFCSRKFPHIFLHRRTITLFATNVPIFFCFISSQFFTVRCVICALFILKKYIQRVSNRIKFRYSFFLRYRSVYFISRVAVFREAYI